MNCRCFVLASQTLVVHQLTLPSETPTQSTEEQAPGGRQQESSAVSQPAKKALSGKEGFGVDDSDVKGSLKVHIKLNLEVDIRIIAKIKGDIAIGIL